MANLIRLEPLIFSQHNYSVILTNNDKTFGQILIEVDGYYYWYLPHGMHGCVSSAVVKELAEKLDELNKEWDTKVQSDPLLKG